MPRTTSDLVKGICEVDVSIDLTPFITAANALVTEACVPAGYDANRLELIETWLAAHFYSIRDPRTIMEKAGEVFEQYENKVALGLNITRYGQQAMLLDTSHALAALSNINQKALLTGKRKAILWLGKKNC